MTEGKTLNELNVQPGDVVECTEGGPELTVGKKYKLDTNNRLLGCPPYYYNVSRFIVVSRASDAKPVDVSRDQARQGNQGTQRATDRGNTEMRNGRAAKGKDDFCGQTSQGIDAMTQSPAAFVLQEKKIMAELPEGYFTVDRIDLDEDCDFGPCKGYVVEGLNLIFYTYDNDPTRVSFHPLDVMTG